MLLTVHHISNPKVTSHPEVKTAICASVALRVAEVVVRDAHSQRDNAGATLLTGVVFADSSH